MLSSFSHLCRRLPLPPAAAGEGLAWDALLDLLRDPSQLGQRLGTGWLTRLLVSAAEVELQVAKCY